MLFSISKRFVIPTSGVVNIFFDGSACDNDFIVFFPVFFQGFGAGPIEIDLYAGSSVEEDGTIIECFNRNEFSDKESGMIIRLNPTIIEDGQKLPPEFEVPSDGIPATAILGGSTKGATITNLNKSIKHMFRLTNTEASPARCVIAANWIE